MLIKLEPTDPAVRERTAAAVQASNELGVSSTLAVRCSRCRAALAQVGDVPGFGPLFTSQWPIRSLDWATTIVNGAKLGDRAHTRWVAERYETVSESGRPLDAPRHHAVTALLALPAEFAQDYPDLLMRCGRHGDYVADRLTIIKSLRSGDDIHAITPIGETLAYETPTGRLFMSEAVSNQTTLRLKADAMDVAEFNARTRRRTGRHADDV